MTENAALPPLVLIHDLLSSPLEFGLLTQILQARQVRFDYLSVPGYTHDLDAPVYAWRQWLAATCRTIDERHGDAPVVVGGLGTGAALAAAVAIERGGKRVRGIAMMSPLFERREQPSSGLHAVASVVGLDRWIAVGRHEPPIRNPKTRKWVTRELQQQGMSAAGPASVPLRALLESDRLHAHVHASLAKLPAPIVVLHASADTVAPVEAAERVVASIGPKARLIRLEHSDRMITIDNDRQRVAHELADFIGAPKRRPDAAASHRPAVAAAAG